MASSSPVPDISSLLATIRTQGTSFQSGDLKARKDLVRTLRTLLTSLETPMEAIIRMVWAEIPLLPVLSTCISMNLFSNLSQAKTNAELAQATNADPILLGRMLKHLAAMSIITELEADKYAPTPLSTALGTQPIFPDSILLGADFLTSAFTALPTFLTANKFQNPTDPTLTAFQQSLGTQLSFFEWLHQPEGPETARQFHNHMAGYTMSRLRWCAAGCVPIDQVLAKETTATTNGSYSKENVQDNEVLLVDIGGGTGQDILHFQKRCLELEMKGRVVLQDLPAVIATCKDDMEKQGIETMAYDFFTPQPVTGARSYYLHSVLHDWPDEKCLLILKQIATAMKPGYSKLLINENVVLDEKVDWEITGLDMIMMCLLSSAERSEKAWKNMLNLAGLKIVKVWTYERGTPSLIEAELL